MMIKYLTQYLDWIAAIVLPDHPTKHTFRQTVMLATIIQILSSSLWHAPGFGWDCGGHDHASATQRV
jgi:hypothetical protein